jgi:restriction system protein
MIPDYQSIMLPMLEILADGKEYNVRDLTNLLADKFNLTEEEKRRLLASGNQEIFNNRVAWARLYLKRAGLISSPKRATFIISDSGRKVIKKGLNKIDNKYLKKFPSFVEFMHPNHDEVDNIASTDESNNETPEETLDNAYQELRKSLASDLLNKVMELSPSFFERLVVKLLVSMGYGGSITDAGKAIGKTGDEGIDGTIKEDKLGLDIIYIQAKRWAPGNVVGRPEIQKFVGALAGQGAKKGIFITTSDFTKDARDYVPKNETKIVLIDGKMLAQLMIDNNIGCTTQHTYELKEIDEDFFDEE